MTIFSRATFFSHSWILRSKLFITKYQTSIFTVRQMSAHMKSSIDISGIYPPITTPFLANEDIAWEKLKLNLEKWEKIPFRGYVVQGSNGEYPFMTADERVDMVKFVKQNVSGKKLIVAGSGCESTRDTISLSQKMASAGANAVLVVTPSYYKTQMTADALEKHYLKVADETPVPVILYSVPGNTGIDLLPESIVRLSKHPNIVGLKDSGGDVAKLANLVYHTQDSGFQILAGSASFLYPALTVGCVGGVCALANVLGQEVCQLQHLFLKGQSEEARLLQQRLVSPNGAVTRRFGVPALKQAMEWFGFYGGPLRMPLQPLMPQQVEIVMADFKKNGFLK